MNKSLLLAYNSVQSMIATTIRTLPYIVVGLVVFALFATQREGWPSKHGEPTTPAREAFLKSQKAETPGS